MKILVVTETLSIAHRMLCVLSEEFDTALCCRRASIPKLAMGFDVIVVDCVVDKHTDEVITLKAKKSGPKVIALLYNTLCENGGRRLLRNLGIPAMNVHDDSEAKNIRATIKRLYNRRGAVE